MIVVISGGKGLIGKALTKALVNMGHTVRILSRTKTTESGAEVYTWDYTQNKIEEGVFNKAEVLIHLAGEGIADKRWTKARKKAIISSRVDSLAFLSQHFTPSLRLLIGGSATGYYGAERGSETLYVNSKSGSDFLAECTVLWEKEEDKIAQKHKLRLLKIRTGIVLSPDGGALVPMLKTTKMGIGSALGDGQQWMSWIHLNDLVRIFSEAVAGNFLTDIINAVAPNPVQNQVFAKTLAAVCEKPFFFPAVPAFILKLIFGEMSAVVLGSTKVETNLPDNFFEFPVLETALKDLLK